MGQVHDPFLIPHFLQRPSRHFGNSLLNIGTAPGAKCVLRSGSDIRVAGVGRRTERALGTLGAPTNPGNPYVGSRTQNAFCTWGGPDIQQTIAEVAARALQKVWYQKWIVHLTHRPEWGAGLVNQLLTGSPLQAQ